MAELFSVVYLSPAPSERKRPPSLTDCGKAFYAAIDVSDGFPYDIGDDPSFFSSQFHEGPISWGVCRADVRGMIQLNDWVVFFAGVDRSESYGKKARDYCFVAALQVQEKITHRAVFEEPAQGLQGYLNLLVRPSDNGWEHYEPVLHRRDWHSDWLWRVARGPRFSKAELSEERNRPVTVGQIRAAMSDLPTNYVIFNCETAIVPQRPIPVAIFRPKCERERWLNDRRSQRIRYLIYENRDRCLRTSNDQQPHRHFRRPIGEGWSQALREAIF